MTTALFHSVAERWSHKVPELLGYSVAAMLAVIYGLIDQINGVLQTALLLVSIMVGIVTFIYTCLQIRNFPKKKRR